MDCLFCKIVKGEIPTLKVYENSSVLAFLDVNPCSLGHTIIIPKKHYQKIEDIPEGKINELFSVITKLVKIIPEIVGTTDCNIGLNNGKFAGQEVPHVHFHIIPRFEGDKGSSIQGLVRMEVDKQKLPELAEKIKNEIENEPNGEGTPKIKSDKKETEVKKKEPTENKPQEIKEEQPTKSPEREWQEFNEELQNTPPDYSEARKEEY
ncbi:MAG: HIT family protein [Candidatus Aenigmarchaeota archaeon]|nr:HIT family protein [Candidatus Aenigmarchaeota archaeon]